MKEKTDNKIPTYKIISIRFKNFRKEINSVWESYYAINYYIKICHKLLKANKIPEFYLEDIIKKNNREFSKD